MIIRKASIFDAEKIAKNNVLLAKESENIEISFETTLEGVKSVLNDTTKGFYLLADEDEEIVGQLMITFEWSDWRCKNIWWIQSVFVDKNFRKKGIFNQLFNKVQKLAIKNMADCLRLYVFTDNDKAIKAYDKIGMKQKSYHIFEYKIE